MEILTKSIDISKNVEDIDLILLKQYPQLLRWAIVKVTDFGFKINVTYQV